MTKASTATSIECPRCGKNSLVQRNDDLYQCLSCDFKRDLSSAKAAKEENNGFFGLLVFVFFVTLLLKLVLPDTSYSNPDPNGDAQSFLFAPSLSLWIDVDRG